MIQLTISKKQQVQYFSTRVLLKCNKNFLGYELLILNKTGD